MFSVPFSQKHKIGAVIGTLALLIDWYVFRGTPYFIPLIAIAVTLGWLPYWLDVFANNKRQKEIESRFPDFVRNVTGAIKSGMPASQAVIHVSDNDYGPLSPYVKKLSHQIEWAIPFHRSFVNFGRETRNPVIKRAIATMVQAEQAGGNLEDVLLAITDSLWQIQRIKQERRASIHAQIMQSYVIFVVFLGVMVIIQNLLIPYMNEFGQGDASGIAQASQLAITVAIDFSTPIALITTLGAWFVSLHGIFLMIGMIQGLFAGVVLGKLAEGDVTSGLKHSLIMMTLAFVMISLAQGFV